MVEVFHDVDNGVVQKALREVVAAFVLGAFRDIFTFPAERKALTTLYHLLTPDQTQFLNTPTRDFLRFLHDAELMSVHTDERSSFVQFQRGLIEGKIEFQDAIKPRLIYTLPNGQSLPMTAVSSFIRGFAGLSIYCQLMGRPHDVVIVDEPAMNAHPQLQMAIIEMLGMLHSAGVSVVVTTHSPYVVDHLNSMIEAAAAPPEIQDELAGHFWLKSKDAFVREDKVAIYEFTDEGDVKDIFDRETRIVDWKTFSDVSERDGELYSMILEETRKATAGAI